MLTPQTIVKERQLQNKFLIEEVHANSSINHLKYSTLTYLLARCHNVYDALDIWQEVQLQLKSSQASVTQSPLVFFKFAIKILNNTVYRNQYSQIITMNMENELNEIGLDENNFWVQIKADVSSQVYDLFWLFYVEKFSIHEISTILNKNYYWIKLVLKLNESKILTINKIYEQMNA